MATLYASPMLDESFDVDKLTNEIFSILENKFLFGCYDDPKKSVTRTEQAIPLEGMESSKNGSGKVRILSIDGSGATDGILAAKSLVHLEACLRQKNGNPNARVSDFFDVGAGSGAGGILAALLFTRGKGGAPMFTADQALRFLIENRKKFFGSSNGGILGRMLNSNSKGSEKLLKKIFGECTLKDTLKSVLIPCYDLSTRAPFLFSRADALELDGYDFKMRDICLATSANPTTVGAVEMRSLDGRTKLMAVDGGIAMNNPTAAAITHVMNNKQEFPYCNAVDDLLVVSLGNGESDFGVGNLSSSRAGLARIAADGSSDMVDQAVSMAFGQCRETNYIRIQASGLMYNKYGNLEKNLKSNNIVDILAMAEEMLAQKNVESVLFQGKKMVGRTNLDKIESVAGELIKEQERRKTSILPTVMLKQISNSPRTSSATSSSTISSC